MQEIWIATNNKDKFKEIKELLKNSGLEAHGAFELPHYVSPKETGQTFADNAKIKAKYLKAVKPEAWVLADDSGLEVPALKNLPGVHSARYAGPTARDIENTAKLLKQLVIQPPPQGIQPGDRTAQFKCVMCLLSPTGEEKIFEGSLKGTIARDMKGKYGFGYDPVFVPENETQTLAELGLAVKNRLSHRARALKQVVEFLSSKLTGV